MTHRGSKLQNKELPENASFDKKYEVRDGDLLVSRANTEELVGASAIVWDTPSRLIIPDKLWRLRSIDREQISLFYLFGFLNSPRTRFEISQRASGTSSSMKNISQDQFLNIEIDLPHISQQRKYDLILHTFRVKIASRQARANETLEALFSSFLAKAFTGEFTATWREANADALAAAAAERDRLLGLRREAPRPSLRLDLSTETGQQTLADAIQQAVQSVAEVVTRHQGQWQRVAATLANSPALRLAEEMAQAQRSYQNVVDAALLRSVAQLGEPLRRSLAAAAAPLAASLRLSEQMSKAMEPALQAAQQWSEQIVQVAALLALRPDPDDPRYPLLKELSAQQMAVYIAARRQPGYFRAQELAQAEDLPVPVVDRGLAVLAETGLIRSVRIDVSPDGRSSYLQTVYRNLDEARDASHGDVDELNELLEPRGA